jgi:hypothetical protein
MFGEKISHSVVTICHGWFIAVFWMYMGVNAQKYVGGKPMLALTFLPTSRVCDISKEI